MTLAEMQALLGALLGMRFGGVRSITYDRPESPVHFPLSKRIRPGTTLGCPRLVMRSIPKRCARPVPPP